ncbi:HpcH/HpaI aldolase/citrate lyase family protein [Pseudomonas yamanorum]|uniref:HpcH/HpaI aldolase/citrate lyase family protein n=1 Tax=Pseudomonas yamanorum TaxID=515393 RepID=UPI003F74FB87
MSRVFPVWRSVLFVPAHIAKFIDKAHERGADAYILDLEDSVAPEQKEHARTLVGVAAASIAGRGLDVLVRINEIDCGGLDDLQAAVSMAVVAVVLPKVASAQCVRQVALQLDLLEAELGMPLGHTLILAQIESVTALPLLDDIASASPRLMGMSLGPEDFCATAGMEPTAQTLFWPNQQVAFACRRAGILPFGFPGSIAEFSDLPGLRQNIELGRQLGMVGAFCIHPVQVALLNDVFSPSSTQVDYAVGLLAEAACAEAEGRGVFAYFGRMIDAPVVAQAQELLARHVRAEQRRKALPSFSCE